MIKYLRVRKSRLMKSINAQKIQVLLALLETSL